MMKRIQRFPALRAAIAYFAIAFAAGFALGIVRELWAVPRFGIRAAELMEAPVMLGVVFYAALWSVARFGVAPSLPARAGMGAVALALLLAAEVSLVLVLRGMTIEEYIAARDPVSGGVYVALLALYALMPLAVLRR